MRIGLIAPPFISGPPKGYGETELFIAHLAEGLAKLGHDLIIYTNGESSVRVETRWNLCTRTMANLGIFLRHSEGAGAYHLGSTWRVTKL